MIIILKKQAEEAKINALKKEMEEQGLGIHESEGVNTRILGSNDRAGMMSNSGAASKMFEALYNRGINIHLIYTSEIKITVLIKESRVERAVEALKEQFQE